MDTMLDRRERHTCSFRDPGARAPLPAMNAKCSLSLARARGRRGDGHGETEKPARRSPSPARLP